MVLYLVGKKVEKLVDKTVAPMVLRLAEMTVDMMEKMRVGPKV